MSEERIRYIYCITNLVNGKNYFGQRTVSTKCTNLLSDMYWGSGKILKLAQKKYGLENFKKEIIISGKFSKEQINRFEKCIIACQRLIGKAEYNIANGGDGGFTGFWGTERCTEEVRKQQSERSKRSAVIYKESYERGREKAKETVKRKKENGWHGWSHYRGLSEEQKEAISNAKKGKTLGAENSSFGKHWWTNGKETIKCEICPEGFWSGRNGSLPKEPKIRLSKEEKSKLQKEKALRKEELLKEMEKVKEEKRLKKEASLKIYKCVETEEIGNIRFWKTKINTNNLSRVVNTNWTINGLHFVTT
jgi:hypothetical protein